MSLIIAKNKVEFEQLKNVKTPVGTDSFRPVPHATLVELTLAAITAAGLAVQNQEFSLARGGLRFFGGFSLIGEGINSDERTSVLGLRNANDKSFAAALCIGNQMLVCENLCFSSDIKLARRHTTNVLADLPGVIADAIARVVSHWTDMESRIQSYKSMEISEKTVAELLVSLADAKALPPRDIYSAVKEFRSPRHPEFKGHSLWSLYNAVTENLKGSDLTKLPFRTMKMQTLFDALANHLPVIEAQVIVGDAQDESDCGDENEPLVVIG